MHLTYSVGSLLPYHNFSTINVYVTLVARQRICYRHMLMCKMDRNEMRVVIKYLNLKGLSAAEISGELNSVLGDNAPSDATIYRWIAEFQRAWSKVD